MKTLNFTLKDEHYDYLRTRAFKERRTQVSILREILDKAIEVFEDAKKDRS